MVGLDIDNSPFDVFGPGAVMGDDGAAGFPQEWGQIVPIAGDRRAGKHVLFVNKKKQKNFDHFWPVALQRP
jgi:hypothetical protein